MVMVESFYKFLVNTNAKRVSEFLRYIYTRYIRMLILLNLGNVNTTSHLFFLAEWKYYPQVSFSASANPVANSKVLILLPNKILPFYLILCLYLQCFNAVISNLGIATPYSRIYFLYINSMYVMSYSNWMIFLKFTINLTYFNFW